MHFLKLRHIHREIMDRKWQEFRQYHIGAVADGRDVAPDQQLALATAPARKAAAL